MAKSKLATGEVFAGFVERDIFYPFKKPEMIISDNAVCFIAKRISQIMASRGGQWKTVTEYVTM